MQDSTKGNFFRHLHLFRAITIILIVAAHCWSFPIFMYADTWSLVPELAVIHAIAETSFHDGTLLFAFISGLLFSLVLKTKGWQRFYRSKLKNVLLPYIVISVAYTLIHWNLMQVGIAEVSPEGFLRKLSSLIHNILLGLSAIHLWYMPVLFILFLLTPLLNKVLESGNKYLILIILIAPILSSRAWPILSWTTIVYFAGAYFAGMLIGSRYQQTLDLIKAHQSAILAVFAVTSAGLIALYLLEIEKLGFVLVRESVFYVQKMALIALLLALCIKVEDKVPKWLDKFGDYSFAIYFVHMGIVIFIGGTLKALGLLSNNPWIVAVIGTLILLATLALSMALTALVKKLSGRYSRNVIGA